MCVEVVLKIQKNDIVKSMIFLDQNNASPPMTFKHVNVWRDIVVTKEHVVNK